ncbi:MAG: hypothetical protein BM557_00065 [Flavobacterium sp. MedPE-SWcel]|uniref:hypothetical protein n=1 Tax=uncultured Flavobacterium sp. TaxID=165435 RepID=UPI000919A443|nr:hypothetical protein [uncultured Flavobacterium sp.]OIQ22418.1 MAG: hypothetical protein BM557_00065 [Flavobacterium sp. MedPE-SWcel]
MRQCFKHKHGYIGIDEENLYLSQSNDWSRILDIKNDLSRPKKRSITKQILLALITCSITAITRLYLSELIQTIIFCIACLVIVIEILRSYKKQTLIPIDQIKSIKPYKKNGVKIHFQDIENRHHYKKIKGVEEKGINILINLPFKL